MRLVKHNRVRLAAAPSDVFLLGVSCWYGFRPRALLKFQVHMMTFEPGLGFLELRELDFWSEVEVPHGNHDVLGSGAPGSKGCIGCQTRVAGVSLEGI